MYIYVIICINMYSKLSVWPVSGEQPSGVWPCAVGDAMP